MRPMCRAVMLVLPLIAVGQRMGVSSELCVTVNDEIDLPLPKAWINTVNLVSQKVYSKAADESGKACFSMPEGIYSIEVGLIGFLNVRYYPIRVRPSDPLRITMRLPLGEGMSSDPVIPLSLKEATLGGTALIDGKPALGGKLCVLETDRTVVSCTRVNSFGEYTLVIPPGAYRTEIATFRGEVFSSIVAVADPGNYEERLVFETRKSK